jgi:uncharacterized protein YkwD
MRSPLILAVAAALVGAASASAAPVTTTQAAVAKSPQAAHSARGVTHVPTLEESVLVLINKLRRERGLVELRINARLVATARNHSMSMAERGYFQHSAFASSEVEAKYGGRQWRFGENLVWASPRLTADQAVRMWLQSPPHRRNLLARRWREIGVGAVHADPAPGVYAGLAATILTADFGVRH